MKNILNKKIVYYSDYTKYTKDIEENYYVYLVKNRILNEAIYNRNLIDNILKHRAEKYSIPVEGWKIDLSHSKIPNAWRWYRAEYTDWIHHWWDVAWNFWDQTIAIDDWRIVRVVSNFSKTDLNLIERGNNLSENDKLKNLDILRGKQVWLKTMKWDVIFYSHLDEVFSNISGYMCFIRTLMNILYIL